MAKKYIDADLIRKEIEKERENIDELFIEGDNNFYDGQDDAYNHTLALIDSLQQEQQEVDLEEEIKYIIERYTELSNDYGVMKPSGIEKIARHFYELGKNSK